MVEHLKRFFTQALQSNLFQDFVFIYGLSILPFTLVGTFLIVLCIYNVYYTLDNLTQDHFFKAKLNLWIIYTSIFKFLNAGLFLWQLYFSI